MARMQVYLPEDLYQQVKARGLSASELLQKAVRSELRRLELLTETDRYVTDLVADEEAMREVLGCASGKLRKTSEEWLDETRGRVDEKDR